MEGTTRSVYALPTRGEGGGRFQQFVFRDWRSERAARFSLFEARNPIPETGRIIDRNKQNAAG
jgi:hypothetical protein